MESSLKDAISELESAADSMPSEYGESQIYKQAASFLEKKGIKHRKPEYLAWNQKKFLQS